MKNSEINNIPSWLRAVLVGAQLAPTHENCQPWRFEYDGQTLSIFEDELRAAHALNRQKHTSLINLGCLMESISMAARSVGRSAYFEVGEITVRQLSSVRVTFGDEIQAVPELMDQLRNRKTDRRLYKGGELNSRLKMELLRNAPPSENVVLHFARPFSQELNSYIRAVEESVWARRKSRLDLMKWFRLNESELVSTADGLGRRAMDVNKFQAMVLKLIQKPFLGSLLLKLGGLRKIGNIVEEQLYSSASLGLITVRTHHPFDLINAGRLLMKTWCRLNQEGMAVHPIAESALGIYDLDTAALSSDEQNMVPLLAHGRSLLTPVFNLSLGEIPVLLFRTGVNSPLPSDSRVLHKPISLTIKKESVLAHVEINERHAQI